MSTTKREIVIPSQLLGDAEKNKAGSGTFIENGKIYANVKREYINPKDLIKDLLKNDYLKDKTKEIKLKNEK